jgi:hypothetical protein
MADLIVDIDNSSAYSTHKEVISSKSVCGNCNEMEKQLKEVLIELSSAQFIIKLLQEESNMNPECVTIEPSSVYCEQEGSIINNHSNWNLVTSNHLTKANKLLRQVTILLKLLITIVY